MRPDGGNVPIKARVICPYFQRHTDGRNTIVCEGVARGVETAMVFRGREQMERYSEKYCETYKYGHCPLARAVSLKIELQNEKAGRY